MSNAPDLTTLPGTVFDVKFSPKTMRIEPEKFIHSLRSISPDHRIYIFDKSSEVARSLQPGKIMFVPGLTLQKVSAIAEDGQDLIVGAEDAALNEAIENGKMKWDYPVNFLEVSRQRKRAALTPKAANGFLADVGRLLPDFPSTVWAAEESAEGKSGETEGWEYNLKAQPDSGGLNFELHLKRKGEAITAGIEATGYIQNFRNQTSIIIQNSKLDSLDFHNSNLNAVVNIHWTVGRGESGPATGEERLRLPTSFSVPLFIGGIPFSLELSEALLFKPGFTSKDEIARGSFKITVNGDDGFKLTSGGVADDSNSKGDGSIGDHGGIAPLAPFAVLIAVAAPRIELSTGPEEVFEQLSHIVPTTLADRLALAASALQKTTVGQWVANATVDVLKARGAAYVQLIASTSAVIGSATALVPCQRSQLVLTCTAGASGKLFLYSKEGSVDFCRYEKTVNIPPTKACSS